MKRYITWVFILFAVPMVTWAAFGDTVNYVGQQRYGDGGFREYAYLDFPSDIASDGKGSFYIADTFNNVIRKINSGGTVSTPVGAGGYGDVDSDASRTKFAHPSGVAVDNDGNIYIADFDNRKIKKFNGSKTTTIASGLGRPDGLAVRGDHVYFTDYSKNALYVMNRDGSNKRAITQSLNGPHKLYVRTQEDYAYVANSKDYTVVRVNLSSGSFSVVAGKKGEPGAPNGSCTGDARIKNVRGVTVIEGGNIQDDVIYFTDGDSSPGHLLELSEGIETSIDTGRVRKIKTTNGDCQVELIVKDSFEYAIGYPNAVVRYGDDLYIANMGSSAISKIPLSDPEAISLYAGVNRFHNRNGLRGLPGRPKDLAITKDKTKVYFSENNQIRMIATKNRRVKQLVGNTIDNYQINDDQGWYEGDGRFSDPLSIALAPDEKNLYVVDRNNNRIRRVDIKAHKVFYFTGAGDTNVSGSFNNGYKEGDPCPNQFELNKGGCAYFTRPGGITIDHKGKYAYVVDTGNQVVRRVRIKGDNIGATKFIAGQVGVAGYADGTGRGAKFNVPIAVTIDSHDKFLYIADRNNHAIRQVRISDGRVTTLTGSPSKAGYLDGRFKDARLNLPVEVYFTRGSVFFTEAGTHMVRVADRTDKAVKLVAGDVNQGYTNGDRKHTQFDNPVGIVRKGSYLLVADSLNDIIRRVRIGKGNIPYTEDPPRPTEVRPNKNAVALSSSETKALRIFGSGFRHGAETYFGGYKANKTYVNSSSELSVVIPFGHMEEGFYEVKVVNTDGQFRCIQRAYGVSNGDGYVREVDHWANCD